MTDTVQNTPRNGVRYDTGPTVAVAVGDLRSAWNGGVFAGDRELADWARQQAEAGGSVQAFGVELPVDNSTPAGALAAMASYDPGRAVVVEAPDEVLALLAREPWRDDEAARHVELYPVLSADELGA